MQIVHKTSALLVIDQQKRRARRLSAKNALRSGSLYYAGRNTYLAALSLYKDSISFFAREHTYEQYAYMRKTNVTTLL